MRNRAPLLAAVAVLGSALSPLLHPALVPALAQAPVLDGEWAFATPEACSFGAMSDTMGIRLTGDTMEFGATTCRMTNPVEVRNMPATLFDMECSAEGDSWSYRALFMLDGDGALVMLTGTEARIMPRCPESGPEAAAEDIAEDPPDTALPDAEPRTDEEGAVD